MSNGLSEICIGIVEEYFPGTHKWIEYYSIACEGMARAEKCLLDSMKQIHGYDEEKIKSVFCEALAKEAAALFNDHKSDFPKTILKRKPEHLLKFCTSCIYAGKDVFVNEMNQTIDFVYCKQEA